MDKDQTKQMWLSEPLKWEGKCLELLLKSTWHSPPEISLQDILRKSAIFPIKFPIDSVRCHTLQSVVEPTILERNINSVYPLMHESALQLCANFLLFKRKHGSIIEKEIYKKLNLAMFIDRLLTKRAVVFVDIWDHYVLLNKAEGYGNWETVGTPDEINPVVIENCLSYDEIKLAALLSVSSYSYFINNGSRNGHGKISERDNIQPEGIIIGLIGPRLVKPEVMEFEECVVTKTQNTPQKCNRSKPSMKTLFSNFYEENLHTYSDVKKMYVKEYARFRKIGDHIFFDNVVYAKRLAISFDTLLLEANQRAKDKNCKAYIHVVGIGLGVWRISSHQEEIFVNTFAERLRVLGSKLSFVSDVDFAFFPRTTSCANYKNGELFPIHEHPAGGIKIHISTRQPFTKLDDPDKLLVVSYAWDGNAQPGNEFWIDCLGNSSDSATASSCQVAELHNSHINDAVCSDRLMVVTSQGSLVPIKKYIEDVKSKSYREDDASHEEVKKKKKGISCFS